MVRIIKTVSSSFLALVKSRLAARYELVPISLC